MEKKKILVVSQHYWPESFRITDICDFFVEQDCEVEVLCGMPNYPKGKFYEGYSYIKNRKQVHNSVKIRRTFEVARGDNSNIRIFLNYISFPTASLFHLPRLLFNKYDKIFIFQTSPVMMALPGILVGKMKNIETTIYVLDLWPENLYSVLNIKNSLARKLLGKISHWHYKKADKLIILSEKMKTKILEVTSSAGENIAVLPQACEKIYEKDIKDKSLHAKYSKGFNIVFTGNLSPAQSFETIIEAAKALKEAGIPDINWIIVGDGMSRGWLEEQVAKENLHDSFFFEGMKPVSDIPKYTNIANLLIGCLVKSDFLEATIPSKVMSYIASGKPLVLAMDGEVQQLINKTIKCGLAGPAGDAKMLTENIKELYSLSASDRQKMGARGREYHFKHFERNIVLQKLYNFIFN